MSLTSLLSAIVTLALLLVIGYAAGKIGYVDAVSTERLSKLIVKIGQPFLIINSLISQEYSAENLKTGLKILLLGLCLHAFMAVIAFLCSRRIRNFDEQKLSEYAMFFANCGFVGFPIVESLYGKEGLFYGAFYIVSFHLFVWTWGILILARKRPDIKITPKSILFNFGTMPCLIGFVLYASQIPLPAPVLQLSSYLAAICTPISIIISGANIARRSLKTMFTSKNVYLVNVVKLLLMPLCAATAMWLLGLPEYMIVFGTIMAAMPCPAVVTMFGELYQISPGYAAELVGSSTVFCTLSIFPMVTYAQFLASHPIW
ncbi:MAG: AEC family transporter [Clostridia bacterium]|nr:AEC family transporter [Clostridia bacterium]